MAAAAVVGNDALQTLGTFLGSNSGRTPLPAQMAFLLGLPAVVLGLGWWLNGGDPAWGRLAQFTSHLRSATLIDLLFGALLLALALSLAVALLIQPLKAL